MSAIELNSPRVIVLEDRGKQYAYTLARIPKKAWLRYFESIVSTSENQNGTRVDNFDSSAARLGLVEDSLLSASGFALPEGVTAIDQVEGWKAMLPLSHRLGIANTLISVAPSESKDDFQIVLGQESIFLDAVWGADSSGTMRKFLGLRHNFRTPSAEQQRRISREGSRSRVIGGSRKGKTQWLGAQATLAELYDELIVSVEGYTVNGAVPVGEAIAEYMDTYHKVAAVDLLFAPAPAKVEGDAD